MNILVTGGSGFIGSHIADALEKNGYKVVLFDTVPSKYKTVSQEEIIGDILNPVDIERAIKDCCIVYHFAAQADISLSSDLP